MRRRVGRGVEEGVEEGVGREEGRKGGGGLKGIYILLQTPYGDGLRH